MTVDMLEVSRRHVPHLTTLLAYDVVGCGSVGGGEHAVQGGDGVCADPELLCLL